MTTIRTPNGEFGVRATAADADVAPDVDVVCLHGFPDDASTFDEVAARLAARGHRVTSVYLRGYSPPRRKETSPSTHSPETSPRSPAKSAAVHRWCSSPMTTEHRSPMPL